MELGLAIGAVKGQFRADDVKEENHLQFVSESVYLVCLAGIPFSDELIKSKINLIIHNDVPVPDQAACKYVHVVNDS